VVGLYGGPSVKHRFWVVTQILLFGVGNAHSFVPALTLAQRGRARSVNDGARDCGPPARKGLSLTDRAPRYAWKLERALGLGFVRYSDFMARFGRSCYEVHGACDVRINLYPAAPFRLAKVLFAWTIVQAGWDSSF
jgi:hypothetical protein